MINGTSHRLLKLLWHFCIREGYCEKEDAFVVNISSDSDVFAI